MGRWLSAQKLVPGFILPAADSFQKMGCAPRQQAQRAPFCPCSHFAPARPSLHG